MKKILLSLASIGTLAGTAAGVASCGGHKELRFDAEENDHLIVLETGLSTGHPGLRALNDIAKKWNDGTSEYKLKIRQTEGGYKAQPGFYQKKLVAKDTQTLPNLWMGYADSAVVVNQYNMLLDMQSEGMDQSLFNDEIIQPNNHMQNVPKGGLYLIPFSKSTETLVLNKTLLNKIFANKTNPILLEDAKIALSDVDAPIWHNILTVDEDDKDIPQWVTSFTSSSVHPFKNELNNFVKEHKDKIFSDWSLLLKFTELLGKALAIPNDSNHFVMGVDSPDNMIMNMAKLYSLNSTEEAEKEKFFYNLDNENKKLTWTSLLDANHPENAYNPGNKAWEIISSSLKAGGVKFFGDGDFSSNPFKAKNLLMVLGSTAGTTYNMSFSGSTYHYNSFKEGTPDNVRASIGKEIKYIKTCEDIFASTPPDTNLCSSDSNAQYIVGSILQNDAEGTPHPLYTFPKASVTEKAHSHNSHLHDLFLPQPYEITKDDGSTGIEKLIYGQGPNLQAIHANAGEDAAVKRIVKWLFTQPIQWDGITDKITAAEYYTQKSNYISGTKAIIDKTALSDTSIGSTAIVSAQGVWKGSGHTNQYLVGPSIAWQSFNKLSPTSTGSEHFHYFVSDTGASTGEFRNNIADTLRGLNTTRATGDTKSEYDTYQVFIKRTISWAETLGLLNI